MMALMMILRTGMTNLYTNLRWQLYNVCPMMMMMMMIGRLTMLKWSLSSKPRLVRSGRGGSPGRSAKIGAAKRKKQRKI